MKRSNAPPSSSGKLDAFQLLMGCQKQQQIKKSRTGTRSMTPLKSAASRFVECPAGCGRHIAEKDINEHLDQCAQEKTSPTKERKKDTTQPHEKAKGSLTVSPEGTADAKIDEAKPNLGKRSLDINDETSSSNAFAHMMKQSAKLFSKEQQENLAQRFHLSANGTLSLICYCTNPGLSQPEGVQWETKVQLKPNKTELASIESSEETPRTVDLMLSSSIPSATQKTRLVHRHSKLSIPVLKSILQKSIRRRKPLPAVRVAMELADKSLGDLLRRLPIVSLEDSTLHPSFSLLVWLMAAHSKSFEPNEFLLKLVLRAVFEMASCPWQDHLQNDDEAIQPERKKHSTIFASYHLPGIDRLLEDAEVYIWAMHMRMRYGGMGCDIRMLADYSILWQARFADDENVPEIVKRKIANADSKDFARWSTIPAKLHLAATQHSEEKVGLLVQQRLAALSFPDITTEGVDFHCSSILNTLLDDSWLVQQALTQFGAVCATSGLCKAPESQTAQRVWLEKVLKLCMWNYSAGVNRRLPLLCDDSHRPAGKNDPLEAVWKGLVLEKAKAFAEDYVKRRLA